MNEIATIFFSLLAGAALGLVYFLALWSTVRSLPTLRWAPLSLLGSLLLRLAILMAGLYWVGGGDWRRFVAALAGLILVRLALTRQIGVLQDAAQPNPLKRSAK